MNMQSEDINELAEALSKAQGLIEGAAKDSRNPFFKSSYADLHSVMACAKEPLCSNGLSVVQTTQVLDGQLCLITLLLHKSGQWIKGMIPISPSKPDPQSIGSAITYFRRYCYSAMIGVAQFDDDGNAAVDRKEVVEKAQTKPIAGPGLNDLIAALAKYDTYMPHEVLGDFVSFMSKKHNTSMQNIIKSALANEEQLDRFNKALLKHQEPLTPEPEAA